MFLSGGLDSTAVLTMMARLNDQPVTTFTCGFAAKNAADERPRARAIAKALGAAHHEVEFTENDFWNLLPQVAAALDDPIIDYATLPTFKLAMEAQQHVKVILSGEGGDEALGGYGRYRKAMRPWPFNHRTKGRFDGMGILYNQKFSRTSIKYRGTKLQQAQANDFSGWLPDNLLIKLDRCLMAHGIEGRTPFLEPQLTDFCFNLPDNYKVKNGLGKHLLREWLTTHGPKTLNYFAKKQGFTVPVGEWIFAHGTKLAPLVAQQGGVAEITSKASVEKLFMQGGKKQTMAAWSLLFYAVWHKIHIEGTDTDGDVFNLLA
jgi:asparagine synthase (glutamine-hydrolysing)